MTSSDKQFKNNHLVFKDYQNQYGAAEVDLLGLISTLWENKRIIISAVLLFSLAGFLITALLPPKWTSKAEITPAEKVQWSQLQQTLSALQVLDVKLSVDKAEVFNLFLKKFNSESLREEFLASSPLVAGKLMSSNPDAEELRRGIVLLAERIKAVNDTPVKDTASMPYQSWTLSFTAPTATEAQQILRGYIDFISALVVKETLAYLREEVELKKNAESASLAMERKRINSLHDTRIKRLNYSLEVANAAGIKRPVYSNGHTVQDDPDYPIALGADGIAEKLRIEKSITDVTRLNADFLYREHRLTQLEKIDIKDIKFTPFKYQLSPSFPTRKEGPSRSLLLILSAMFGGIIASTVVLVRHSLQQRKYQ
ncbi:LPS O-antigen length regulator [Kosakonia radicincitans]|uniref:LPS O-antigen length regulator Wzz(fepE) n=1 Tax=Kosakonia radicincitans TaxID=283686 RepID=UPI0011EE98C2|nr:LPS O-antigen length regulator Wzz(fepE) [Kosakonia radicincitans]QEM92758.1 LPS O-antigen length regulator [Kosakonia radicincitans]